MEKLAQLLSSLGVSEQECTLYTLLFTDGSLPVVEIAKRTKLHRPRVYALIASLRARGLIDVLMRGKRREYVAASPQKLKDIVDKSHVVLRKFFQSLLIYMSRKRETYDHCTRGPVGVSFS